MYDVSITQKAVIRSAKARGMKATPKDAIDQATTLLKSADRQLQTAQTQLTRGNDPASKLLSLRLRQAIQQLDETRTSLARLAMFS